MGRNKLPDQIKSLRGTDQPCRKSNFEAGVISKLPPPPKYFSKTAKSIYKTIGAGCVAARILSPMNLPQFLSYCQEMSIYFDANENIGALENRIETVTTDSGTRTFVAAMPKVATTALQNAYKLSREFGFTPATASRIAVSIKKDNDEFSNFMNS